jgi:hypothetical protein
MEKKRKEKRTRKQPTHHIPYNRFKLKTSIGGYRSFHMHTQYCMVTHTSVQVGNKNLPLKSFIDVKSKGVKPTNRQMGIQIQSFYILFLYVCMQNRYYKLSTHQYLHININYHTKPLARKSLVFVYQPIKLVNCLLNNNFIHFVDPMIFYILVFVFVPRVITIMSSHFIMFNEFVNI